LKPLPRGGRTTLLTAALVVAGLFAGLWTFRRELLAFFILRDQFERLPHNEQGYAEYRHRATGIVFVRLPGGTFLMGSGKEERQHDNPFISDPTLGLPEYFVDEEPRHVVTVSPFLIAKYEVSQTQWANVMGTNPSHVKGEDHPVEWVTWDECLDFCRRTGLSLPTEAQWEYACRAGTSGPYGGSGLLEEMGWGGKTAAKGGHRPVGQKKANGFGLHDMHGNVSEWVEDVMDEAFYSRPEALGLDPVCTTTSPERPDCGRVARGGGTHHALFCRSAVRVSYQTDTRSADLGFRPAFNLR